MRGNGSITIGGPRGSSGRRAPVSPQVAALRRRVWLTRLAFFAAIAVVLWTYDLVLERRTAPFRAPQVALAADSTVYADATQGLLSHVTQLALQASMVSSGGKPLGPVGPAFLNVQLSNGRWSARLSGLVTVGESGYPILTVPVHELVAHRLDRRGLVDQITLETTYLFCWDRGAGRGRVLPPGESPPVVNISDRIGSGLVRYSETRVVVDRLTLNMNLRTGHWEIDLVERLSSAIAP